ncbi:Asp-tRNA(Asn)/Glu-tRNA(Gln) amidotransferase subunit GatC [Candidatus Poribacteria bacterium]
MAKITIQEVEHVANLARLTFDEEQKEKLAEQLAEILDYIEQLNELDTEKVEPTSHAIPVKNVVRPDVVAPSLTQDEALANAPSNVGGLFEVPKIVE